MKKLLLTSILGIIIALCSFSNERQYVEADSEQDKMEAENNSVNIDMLTIEVGQSYGEYVPGRTDNGKYLYLDKDSLFLYCNNEIVYSQKAGKAEYDSLIQPVLNLFIHKTEPIISKIENGENYDNITIHAQDNYPYLIVRNNKELIVFETTFGRDLYRPDKPYNITYSESFKKYEKFCKEKEITALDLYTRRERKRYLESIRKGKSD